MNSYVTYLRKLVTCLLSGIILLAVGLATARGYTELPDNSDILATSGSIVGTVTWDAEVPLPFQFEARADSIFCAPQSQRTISRSLITIDPKTHAVQGALLYLNDIRAGAPLSSATINLAGTIEFDQCCIRPAIKLTPERAALELVTHDEFVHTPMLDLGDQTISDDLVTTGMLRKFTISHPGIYTLRCRRHIWEYTTIFAIEHPYYSLTNSSGEFTLQNVPAGSYTLELYHPTISPEPVTRNGVIVDYKFSPNITQTLKVLVRREQSVSVEFVLPSGGARFSQ